MKHKILYVQVAAERGGIEVLLLNILRGLDRSCFEPTLLFLSDGPFVEEVRATNTEAIVLPAGRLREFRSYMNRVRQIAEMIKREGFHLVHSKNAVAHIYGGFAAARAYVPSIYHLYSVPSFSLSWDGVISLWARLVPASSSLGTSQYVAEAYQQAWKLKNPLEVIHAGIDIATLGSPKNTDRLYQEFNLKRECPLVVMVGRLQHWKGMHVFVSAAASVVERIPDAQFLVVGGTLFGFEEDYPQELKELATTLGIQDKILFTGYRPDVYRFMAIADILVHCSIQPDPFPTVILEAMALGKPVIASNSGGCPESVQHGKTGLLVPPNNPGVLAEAIVELISNPALCHEMGMAGSVRLNQFFTATHMVTNLQNLYARLINAQSPSEE